MKKNIFLHLTIATFFLGLSACTDDNLLPPVENNVPTIDAGLLEDYYFILDTDIPQTHMPQTRVSYINERESYFDEGDEMGIFVINENNELIGTPLHHLLPLPGKYGLQPNHRPDLYCRS